MASTKQPAFLLYPGDWLKDPALSMCAPATRGIWIDLICAMREGQTGTLSGTTEQLSRLARCSAHEMLEALIDLADAGAADVDFGPGCHADVTRGSQTVTVKSRRVSRDVGQRKSSAARQRRKRTHDRQSASHERHARVTAPLSSSSSSSSSDEVVASDDDPVITAFSRWKGVGLSSSEVRRIGEFVAMTREIGDIDIRGSPIEPDALICECVEQAVQSGATFSAVGPAVSYVRAIVERCRHDGTRPSDYPGRDRVRPDRVRADRARRADGEAPDDRRAVPDL